jgi:ubiquitin carboxyl-terminal hydrolase 16/45
LSSIAPRYHSRTGECSIYSSLSQFTAPELLTGSNKWACDRCTELAAGRFRESDEKCSDDSGEDGDEKVKKSKKKPPTVYSNASKQLLIFSPPAVLTIHLKR